MQQIANLQSVVIRSQGSTPWLSTIFLKRGNMKPTAAFRLSKQTKRFMCTILNPVERHEFKNAMIRAELAAAVRPKATKNDRQGS